MLALKEQLQSLPSLAGIVNTAMVLKDEFLYELTFECFADSMAPKIKGKLQGLLCFVISLLSKTRSHSI